jgi:hypothetical protein
VLNPEGLTEPLTVAAVALVALTPEVVAVGAPAVKLIGAPTALPELLLALTAAQYCVPVVRPVMFTVTAWPLASVNASAVAVVALAGEPVAPWLVHQPDVARS